MSPRYVSIFLLILFTSNTMLATNCAEILVHLQPIPAHAIIFVDIDDTMITPVSKTFRSPPYNQLIDEIKKNKERYTNYEAILSQWRLQRKVMLIDEDWPATLEKLKKQYRVYGLTKMDTGALGAIESIEHWRYAELKSLGIEFSDQGTIPPISIHNASFYKGLFFTGPNSKSQTLLYFLEYLKGCTFVMIDDRQEHIEDIRQLCQEHSIPFIGIHFKGLEQFKDKPDPAIAALQKQYLIESLLWLEDEDAEKLLQHSPLAP